MNKPDNKTVVKVLAVTHVKGQVLVGAQLISGSVDLDMIFEAAEDETKWRVVGLGFLNTPLPDRILFTIEPLEPDSNLREGMTLVSETHGTSMLREQWITLLQNWSIPPAVSTALFTDLAQRYTAPNRHYHNLDHIAFVLQLLEELRPLAHDFPTLQLAAWFHDAVYEPGAADNEEQSAALAERALTAIGLPPATVAQVKQLILATKHHQPIPGNEDSKLLLDADLASLAAEPAEYAANVQAVRQEYAHVPDEAFRRGRVQILQAFLDRPRLYQTEPLYTRLEQRARANLQREIATLKS
jgi:predicted metal-dependent HD superfamily phosphohydrolase